jgi:hypothetical protein
MENMSLTLENPAVDETKEEEILVQEDRLWQGNNWTARIIKNEEDEGWAVAMLRDGEPEPALVGPWTMGRDKKNPKPLYAFAFGTLVKAATEVVRRHEQQREAMLHKTVYVTADAKTTKVVLDITPDEDNPSAALCAFDEEGELLAQVRVDPTFKLNAASASAWIESGFNNPA